MAVPLTLMASTEPFLNLLQGSANASLKDVQNLSPPEGSMYLSSRSAGLMTMGSTAGVVEADAVAPLPFAGAPFPFPLPLEACHEGLCGEGRRVAMGVVLCGWWMEGAGGGKE
jgi:hypothetical protein